MKYCRFQTANGPRYGRIDNNAIASLLSFTSEHAARPENFTALSLGQAKLLAPVVPSKIICVGRNYREHASELGHEVPAEPLIFLKPPSAIIGPEDVIQLPPPNLSQRVDFEGELGVVIGRRCRQLTDADDTNDYIRGYTCINDVTARDLQKKDGQWTRAKGFDTFCPVGPLVVSAEELPLSHGLDVSTRLNGDVRQYGNTREFIFSIDHVIRYISQVMTLEPGDLISTGTPAGVGSMQPGDMVEVTVTGIGTLRNVVT